MTAGMLRRIAKLEGFRRAARVIVVSDYGDTDVDAEVARQLGGSPRQADDLIVVLRKYVGERPGRSLQ